MKLEGFNVFDQLLPEYMHNICLGIVKKLTKYTFNDTSNVTKCKGLFDPTTLNRLLLEVKVPKEFSRVTRKISLGSFKAEEYRNFLLFFFPAIIRQVDAAFQ